MKNEYFILLVILIVVSLVVIAGSKIYGIFDGRRKRKKPEERALRLKEFGPQVPFHSLPNANVISKFTDSTGLRRFGFGDGVSGCFFRKGGLAMNLMEGNMGSIDFVTYDYEYSEGGGPGDYSRTFRGTAILLQSDQLVLPSFKWGPKGVQSGSPPKVRKLFELVSKDDLRGWTALASNTQLLLYWRSTVPAEKYQEFIEKALKIFQMFQSASQNLNEHA